MIRRHQVRIRVVGALHLLPAAVREAIQETMETTGHYRKKVLTICCPYTARYDMMVAKMRTMVKDEGKETTPLRTQTETHDSTLLFWKFEHNMPVLSDEIDHDDQDDEETPALSVPPLDLLIRTSGEVRLSDFMLYSVAYHNCQVYFTNVLWPEINKWHLLGIVFLYMVQQSKTRDSDTSWAIPVALHEE